MTVLYVLTVVYQGRRARAKAEPALVGQNFAVTVLYVE